MVCNFIRTISRAKSGAALQPVPLQKKTS